MKQGFMAASLTLVLAACSGADNGAERAGRA